MDSIGTPSCLIVLVMAGTVHASTEHTVSPEDEGSVNGDTALTFVETLMSAGVMLVLITVSWYYELDLESQVGIATFRTIVQLSILGYILAPVFEVGSPIPVVGVITFMLCVVTFEAQARLTFTYVGISRHIIIAMISGLAFSVTVALVVVRPSPWYSPQYVIPLFGMLLGASLTAVCLGLGEFMQGIAGSPGENVEFLLANGATRHEAVVALKKQAVSKGIIPTLNTMNVIGLVAIPGMMTGQILGGASPIQAARYQMMILFLISSSACTVVIIAVSLAINTIIDENDCLHRELLVKKKKDKDVITRVCVFGFEKLKICCGYLCRCGKPVDENEEEVEFVTVHSDDASAKTPSLPKGPAAKVGVGA